MRKTVGFACNDCTMTKSVNNCPDMGVCNRCANASSEEDVSCGDSTIEDGTNEYEDSCYLESEPGGLCAEADDKYCKKSYSCTTGSPSFGLDCSSVSGNCVGPTANWCSECSRRLYGSISSSKFSNNECEF
ncbi:MAG: hypothetical protein OEW48_12445 [Phycisphaerae bacterium]|nr:hypothetical protein [Phycisphaerae bacterium]